MITVKFYSSFRKTDEIEDILKDYRGIMFDVKTYENMELEDLIKKEKKINYGNEISECISFPFNIYDKNSGKNLDTFNSKIKNKRKPTDIIIIADGFSYSAASVFLKNFQYYKGGIRVGYFDHLYLII